MMTQLGMTATPLREDNRDTYASFGAPLYTPVVTAVLFPDTSSGQFKMKSGVIAGRSAMRDVLALIPVMTQKLPFKRAEEVLGLSY